MRALFLAAVALFLIATFAAGSPAGAESDSKKRPVVGTVYAKDKIELHADIVKKTFADGGKVDIIALQKIKGQMHLVRMGHDVEGRARTEAMRLTRDVGSLVPDAPLWVAMCYNPLCEDTGEGDGDESATQEAADYGDKAIGQILNFLADHTTLTIGATNLCTMDSVTGDTCTCSETGSDCLFGIATDLLLHDFLIEQ